MAKQSLKEDEDEKEEAMYCSCPEVKYDRKELSKENFAGPWASDFVNVLHSEGSLARELELHFPVDRDVLLQVPGKVNNKPLII